MAAVGFSFPTIEARASIQSYFSDQCFFYPSVAQKCLGLSNYYNRLFEKNTNSFSKVPLFLYTLYTYRETSHLT